MSDISKEDRARYEAGVFPRPWYKWTRPGNPVRSTLKRWRRLAAKNARLHGARWACGLCKRPMGNEAEQTGSFGQLLLRAPGSWGYLWHRRRICMSCFQLILDQIDRWETTLHNDMDSAEVQGDEGAVLESAQAIAGPYRKKYIQTNHTL
jgi:hypothetical protein